MKVYKDGKFYIQKKDWAILSSHVDPSLIPESIRSKKLDIDRYNAHEFIQIESPSEIEFFEGIDWIPCYNDYSFMSRRQFEKMDKELFNQRIALYIFYLKLPPQEAIKRAHQIFTKIDLLDYERGSLCDIYMTRKGVWKLELPQDEDENAFQREIKRLKNVGKGRRS